MITLRGGCFFLLNVLALPAAQEHLAREEEFPGAVAGWLWLYRLGRCLGVEADPPLAGFLAWEVGLEDPGELDGVPPLRCEAELRRLAEGRFGGKALRVASVDLPALVSADRSHVDVHYRLADARLEVRRVGLDVNPGWLPWLGRVVTFHYGAPPELARLDEEGPQ